MPLYEYQCDACAHRFEVIQKFSDAPVEVCPKCGGAVKKLLSSPAIQFKGTGWYVTDYAGKGRGSEKGGDESKGDAKPAAKTDSSGTSASGETKKGDAPASTPSPKTD